MLETKTLLQNRYLIERQIGSGGMGAVYLAVDERFGSYVAIKETFYKDKELGSAFEREAHLLNSLHHPVLPHVSDYFTDENGHFLVMQFIDGEDLFEILKREGVFPIRDVMRWTDSLLDALDYLHSQNPPIIHRDIKPQNLKITGRGDVILLDFGLAKLNSDNDSGMKSVFGYSRKYSPLEQIQGTGTDARSDLFALAATIYHLLTGTPPLDALTRASAIVDGGSDPLPPAHTLNNEISAATADVLTTALALNASKRFDSAKAMRQALGYALNFGVGGESKTVLEPAEYLRPVDASAVPATEIESFPALESFAAETLNNSVSSVSTNDFVQKGNSLSEPSAVPPAIGNRPPMVQIPIGRDVSETKNRKSIYGAAIFGALVCVSLAAWYYTKAANPAAVETPRNPAVATESSPVVNAEVAVEATPVPKPEATNSPVSGAKKETGIKPPKIEPVVQRIEPVEEISIRAGQPEKPKIVSVKPTTRPVPNRGTQKTSTAGEIRRREAILPGNAQTEVPDIESIFSGRSSQERANRRQRQENQRSREDMTPNELEEFRRIRREERRRQNRRTLPPF